MFSSFGARRWGGVQGARERWYERNSMWFLSFIFISQLPGHSVPFLRCWQLEIRCTAIHFGKLLIFPSWGSLVRLDGGENVPRSWVSCASSRFIIVSAWGPPCCMHLFLSEWLCIDLQDCQAVLLPPELRTCLSFKAVTCWRSVMPFLQS